MRQILRKAKRRALSLAGKDFFEKPNVQCSYKKFGVGCDSWDVAEGYLDHTSVVYSFGIGVDASFDMALIARYGMIVDAFDPTPKSIAWARSQNFTPKFRIHEYGLADFDGEISFNPPENPEYVSYTILERPATQASAITVPVKRIRTIMRELSHTHIDLLKLDIEGAEYRVLDDICSSNVRPR